MGSKQKDPKTHKSKILSSGWMQDMEKWFGRWDATHLLHDVSLDSFVNEAFLQCQRIMTWDKCELIRPLMMVEALYYYNRQ